MTIIERVKKEKIIAIVRGINKERVLDTCKALYAGGISMIEVTFNQSSPTGNKDTYEAIKLISESLGDKICVGAGTVMTMEQLELAVKAGAKYIISPNYDKAIVARTVELGAASMPGVLTPSEIVDAYNTGAIAAKIFPIGTLGIDYLKAIKTPISHIPMIAVGGVDLDNLAEYINAGAVGVGIGSCLVNKKLIDAGKYDELTELAKKFVEQVLI
ncbi:MAG: bifunctional 4-hydroxy-2-oxoglutarate aldolase/2-dehydro-3-deoxy-phosphogluconate aldolase [Vallitaleaceae bacterium]|nr:bifunctional 4-hydroxy-2-oxoglutarate aldolase/2-dehydro-3-deoxy-phosphogluconate aldolase [Vallitaleaceae bacterium]